MSESPTLAGSALALFDFDGTITTLETMPVFLRRSIPRRRLPRITHCSPSPTGSTIAGGSWFERIERGKARCDTVSGREEGMDAAPPISFSVRYRLVEYLRFVTAHAFDTDPALRDLQGARRVAACLTLLLVGTAGFVWKTARVGRCDFVVDGEGVRRRTQRGWGSVPWSRVKAIHAYAPGLLIELNEGAVPLPFRVLTDAQRAGILHVASASGASCSGQVRAAAVAMKANARDWR